MEGRDPAERFAQQAWRGFHGGRLRQVEVSTNGCGKTLLSFEELIFAGGKPAPWRCSRTGAFQQNRWARDRDLRHLYIRGATPEQAVDQVQTSYWNTRSFERMRPR
jgi:hypothetical protein